MLSIVRRGKIYHARFRVPVDLQKYFGKTEITRSLQTRLYRQAKSLVSLANGEIEGVCVLIRSGVLSDTQIKKMVKNLIDSRVSWFDRGRNREIVVEDPEDGDLQYDIDWYHDHLDGLTDTDYDETLKDREKFIADSRKMLARNRAKDHAGIAVQAQMMLRHIGVSIDKESPEYLKLCNEILKGIITAETVITEHMRGNYETPYDVELRNQKKSHTLQETITAFIDETSTGKRIVDPKIWTIV